MNDTNRKARVEQLMADSSELNKQLVQYREELSRLRRDCEHNSTTPTFAKNVSRFGNPFYGTYKQVMYRTVQCNICKHGWEEYNVDNSGWGTIEQWSKGEW